MNEDEIDKLTEDIKELETSFADLASYIEYFSKVVNKAISGDSLPTMVDKKTLDVIMDISANSEKVHFENCRKIADETKCTACKKKFRCWTVLE